MLSGQRRYVFKNASVSRYKKQFLITTNYDNDEVNLVFETTRLMIQKGKEAEYDDLRGYGRTEAGRDPGRHQRVIGLY